MQRIVGFLVTSVFTTIGLLFVSPSWGCELSERITIQQETTVNVKSRFEGVIIDTISVEVRNVFDTLNSHNNKFIYKTANRFHKVTKAPIIKRELLLKPGQPFLAELALETTRNLRTRCALYDAWIEPVQLPDGRLLVKVVTIDQWSLLVNGSIKKEGDFTNYNFGIEEQNLLGNNQMISFDYYIQKNEDNYFVNSFRDYRFLGFPVSVNTGLSTDPVNKRFSLSLGHPYYNLSQRFAFSTMLSWSNNRLDYYNDSLYLGRTLSKTDFFSIVLSRRWGSYHRKIKIEAEYDYHSSGVEKSQISTSDSSMMIPSDSTYHIFQLTTGFEDIRYSTARKIDGFGITEDIVLQRNIAIGFGRALNPSFSRSYYDVIHFGGEYSNRWGSHFAFFNYNRYLYFPKNSEMKYFASMSLKYYFTCFPFATFATRIMYLSDSRNFHFYPYILGGTSGLRGYNKYYQTGNKLFLTNVEIRIIPGIEILSTRFGGVVFVDAGRTFKDGATFTIKNLIISSGLGLRISFERTAKTEMLRIDASHTKNAGWQVSVGSSQYF